MANRSALVCTGLDSLIDVDNSVIGNVGLRVSDWIKTLGSPEQQLEGIMEIFDIASEKHEILGEVAEAWAIMIQDRLWNVKSDNEKTAIKALQPPIIKTIVNYFKSGRKRKEQAIRTIQSRWSAGVTNGTFDTMSEGILALMASVSKKFDLPEAKKLIAKVSLERLREIKSGRGSERRVIAKDWRSLNSAGAIELARLRDLPPSDAQDLIDHELTDHILEIEEMDQHSQTMGSEPAQGTQKDMDNPGETDSTESSEDPAQEISNEVSDIEKPTKPSERPRKQSCCRGISRSVVNRLNRADPFSANMDGPPGHFQDTEGVRHGESEKVEVQTAWMLPPAIQDWEFSGTGGKKHQIPGTSSPIINMLAKSGQF